jgi:LDH2 family malate/lactate/ureidoglycolate dehydrogenase
MHFDRQGDAMTTEPHLVLREPLPLGHDAGRAVPAVVDKATSAMSGDLLGWSASGCYSQYGNSQRQVG